MNEGRKRKEIKESPPNRGTLDQRLPPEGNHIFHEENDRFIPRSTTLTDTFVPASVLRGVCGFSRETHPDVAQTSERFCVDFLVTTLLLNAVEILLGIREPCDDHCRGQTRNLSDIVLIRIGGTLKLITSIIAKVLFAGELAIYRMLRLQRYFLPNPTLYQ